MGARGALVSPVQVGRDDLLALAERRLDAAVAGSGQVLFLAGEAGIGKTRLLESVVRRAGLRSLTVFRGAAFPGDQELAGGLLLDLARDLSRSPDPIHRDVGAATSARLLGGPAPDGDRHRHRRLLTLDLAELLAGVADQRCAVVALEDLHWADDLTLEVLGQLARRLPHRRLLVLATYRNDELFPRVPMREWRSRLLTQRLAEEARLARLNRAQTATMVGALLGTASNDLVATVYQRSDGIPLHVEELLGALDTSPADPAEAAAEVARAVPDTLADAILTRAEALPPQARWLATAASVIGRSFDFDLLVAVTAEAPQVVAEGLRHLADRHFVVPAAHGASYDFRHALIRDVLYADLALPRRRELHARVARIAAERGDPAAFLSVNFEHAGLTAEAYQHAIVAATEASALSAHREALELYRRARRCEPNGAAPADRAGLLAALAAEAAANDENAAAAAAYEEARRLLSSTGAPVEAAALLPALVSVRHLLGDGLVERVASLQAGLDDLDAVVKPDRVGTVQRLRARLLAGISAAYMLDRRLDESISYGERARHLAARGGDEVAELNILVTLGSVLVFAGRMDEGWQLLEDAVTRAVARGAEAEAARAYRMIGSSASVLVEYDRAERWLSDGIAYAGRVELWNHRHYMAAHLAHVRWARGDWDGAEEIATHTLTDGRGGITTRVTALHVLGFVALARGSWADAGAHLSEARAIGERMGELQRLSPAVWGLAELALLRGDHARATELCERGYAESAKVADAAYLFPFVLTGTRALLRHADAGAARRWVERCAEVLHRRGIPGTLPALDHATGLVDLAAGHTGNARQSLGRANVEWQHRGRWWEGTFAQLDLAACAGRSGRRAEAASLVDQALHGATRSFPPISEAAEEVLRGLSNKNAEAWHPLTAREYQVAKLVTAGMTNRQIAAELVLSPKTVSAHVEHILAKLGATRRTEIAAWAATIRDPDQNTARDGEVRGRQDD